MTGLVLLQAPAPEHDTGRFTAAAADDVAEWLHGQPLGNPTSTANALLEVLRESNRAPLRRLSRLDFTELLRPTVYDICESLAHRFASQALPLPEGYREEYDLARRLLAELAAGYRLAVNGTIRERPVSRGERLTLQVASQRALLAHGRELVEVYRVHAPEPAGVWAIVHRLYHNAEALNLQAMPIEGTQDAEETLLSIRQAYLRLAMLSLANPYHLMQGEAQELYRRIGRWVHFARMTQVQPDGPIEGRFITDLESDLPPRYVARQQAGRPPANARDLDVSGVVKVVDEQIETLDASLGDMRRGGMLSERLKRDMYVRFRNALGAREERTSPRAPTVSSLRLVTGIGACHYVLNDQIPFNPEHDERRWRDKLSGLSTTPAGQGLTLAEKGSYLDPANKSGGVPSRPRFEAFDAEADDIWQKANRAAPARDPECEERAPRDIRPQIWRRKNESDGGFAAFCPRNSVNRTRVGDLVAWSGGTGTDVPPGQEWSLGVVRWLRTREQAGLELGVQLVAESGFAAGARGVAGQGQGAGYVRALITPRVNPADSKASLILPAGVFDTQSILALNLRKLVIHARLTEVLDTTRLFTHFRFQICQAPASR